MPGSLFIVAAPSGAGKTSLVKGLLAREQSLRLSISHTTRPPRPNEENGRHYHFVDATEFERLAQADAFLEHAEVHGNRYGTSRVAVEPILAAGDDVLLEIDFQGARSVRCLMPECVSIFILPPSRAELERRLRARASDSEAVIQRRLANSREELAHVDEFDYVIVNDAFERALEDLVAIVRSTRLRRVVQGEKLRQLVDSIRA
jgi:guanylate kinase